MLFFKELFDEKLKNHDFQKFYETECHICAITMKVVAALEENKTSLPDVLDQLRISRQVYEDLKDARNCNPELVKQLCRYLGFTESDSFKNCPK